MIGVFSADAMNKGSDKAGDKPEYYRYSAPLPEHSIGYWLVPKPYLTDLDPSEPPALSRTPSLHTFETQEEEQPKKLYYQKRQWSKGIVYKEN